MPFAVQGTRGLLRPYGHGVYRTQAACSRQNAVRAREVRLAVLVFQAELPAARAWTIDWSRTESERDGEHG